MDHVAIMRKDWCLTDKILSGEKKIESRWYKLKRAPWNQIDVGDTIYFKDSGEPVKISAKVGKVMQIPDLNTGRVREIMGIYGREDGIEKKDLPGFIELFKDKKYCILIYLKDVQKVKPFNIDKTGFGAMSAWITLSNVNQIKKY